MTAIGTGIGTPFLNHQGFNPFAFGRPFILLDAAKGITLNVADVSAWADQSGDGNGVSQDTAADQPLFNLSDSNFNGNPSITFDGVREFFDPTVFASDFAQPNTVFAVYKIVDTANSRCIFDSEGTPGRHFVFVTAAENMTMGAPTARVTVAVNTDVHVSAFLFDGVVGGEYRDGGTLDVVAGDIGTDGMGAIQVGALVTPTAFWQGEIAYILAYNADLSDIAKNYIGNGLAARFGTTWTDI